MDDIDNAFNLNFTFTSIQSNVDVFAALLPPSKVHYGPTDASNWVLLGRVIAGSYPGDLKPEKANDKVKAILTSGITTFVCLQTETELKRFHPYKNLVEEQKKLLGNTTNIEFVNFQIPDTSVASDKAVKPFIESLIKRLVNNEILYIHCWGGHGRTGTIIALLLGRLYPITPDQALYLTNAFHDMRVTQNASSPQTPDQFEQVRRLLNEKWWL